MLNVTGLERLVFAVPDVAACRAFARDYGLVALPSDPATYEAADGTCLVIVGSDATGFPPAIAPDCYLREIVYGGCDEDTLTALAQDLARDREVRMIDGRLHTVDDDGYAIAFQISERRALGDACYGPNRPGSTGRPANVLGARDDEVPAPLTLSHIVLYSRDNGRAERFYADRLGFRVVDRFSNAGPFMRPAGTDDHHTLFLIQSDRLGLQHFTFHFADGGAVMKAGWEMVRKGHESRWGPGRHIFGSNFFWYFHSPFGAPMEMDADMDRHDDSWVPRVVEMSHDTSQTFAFQYVARG